MGLRNQIWTLMFIVTVLAVSGVRGQNTVPSCVNELIPCQQYISSSSPPGSCCGPLKKAVETEFTCLCNLFQNEEFFNTLNINRTTALQLPKHCGITSNFSSCPVAAAVPSQQPTAGVDNKSGASTMALMGMPGLVSLLLIWISMLV